MALKGGIRGNKIYVIITIIVIILIILTILLSSPSLEPAYIEDKYLKDNGWSENIFKRGGETGIFGLEKSISYTYSNNNDTYPAYITVTTFKTLFTMNEEELLKKTDQTILDSLKNGIELDLNSRDVGSRANNDHHSTKFIVYSGNDTSKEPKERIKIIGETWNCGDAGTSIICIGFAQITDNLHNDSNLTIDFFSKIAGDSSATIEGYYDNYGLLFYVKCH